jgi:hypothetical protein
MKRNHPQLIVIDAGRSVEFCNDQSGKIRLVGKMAVIGMQKLEDLSRVKNLELHIIVIAEVKA